MYFIYFTESLWKGIKILNNLFYVIFVHVYHFFLISVSMQLSLCLLFLFIFIIVFINKTIML
jgi:hypothetical protein